MDCNNTKQRLWQSDLGNGMYRNPVLYADYSDPDAIRVGDTFYMTASSFNYIPGLPILTSKDLIHWKLVNYAVKKLPYPMYDKPAHAKGIWAPSIRYHDSMFWIFVGMPDEGIFMTNTRNPLGEWSPLKCIREGKGFIDPCPLWDEDGRAYIIHGYAKSRIGFNSKLGIFEMNPQGTECISEDRFVFDGTETQPTIEGPKVYRRDGFYYIFAPAGGVSTGWQTVLRSRCIYGPYEEKIVLHQGNTEVNGPHQGALINTETGEDWFLHFQDKGVYGRIVHLQPVTWQEGWPLIGVDLNNDGIGEPVEKYKKPVESDQKSLEEGSEFWGLEADDNFSDESLKLQWQWLANDRKEFYSLKKRLGSLCLYPMNTTGERKTLLWNSANVLTQKILCPDFTAEAKIDFSMLPIGAKTGMILIGGQYAAMYVERRREGFRLAYIESVGEGDERTEHIVQEYSCVESRNIIFRMNFYKDGTGEFQFYNGKDEWSVPTRRFFPKGAVWVGAKIGLFALSDQDTEPKGKAFIEYFRVRGRLVSESN